MDDTSAQTYSQVDEIEELFDSLDTLPALNSFSPDGFAEVDAFDFDITTDYFYAGSNASSDPASRQEKREKLRKAQEDAIFLMSQQILAKKQGNDIASKILTPVKKVLDSVYEKGRAFAMRRLMKIAKNFIK